jgi:hypothetical protein
MTANRKYIIDRLLEGWYLVPWKRPSGAKCFRLYNNGGAPIHNFRQRTFAKLDSYVDPKIKIWKKDKLGRITLNLSSVRQLHGRSYIKQAYLKSKANK